MRRIAAIVILAVAILTGTVQAEDPGVCLTDDEAELLGLINEYRADNGLPPIPWSKSLSKVGQLYFSGSGTRGLAGQSIAQCSHPQPGHMGQPSMGRHGSGDAR